MPTPIPVITQIMSNIADTLEGVTTAHGYQVDLAVNRAGQLPASPETGLVLLRLGDDSITDEAQVPSGWTEHNQTVEILVNLCVDEDEEEPVDNLLRVYEADILKALRLDINRGNLAIDTKPVSDDELYPPEGTFYVTARVSIQYRTLWNDPYSGMGDAA